MVERFDNSVGKKFLWVKDFEKRKTVKNDEKAKDYFPEKITFDD